MFVFARAPQYGAVKTRLSRDIGAAETLRFYRTVLNRVLRRLGNDARWDVVIAATPDGAAAGSTWWPRPFPVVPQGGGDLGRRMVRALRSGGNRPCLVVGSDIPDIQACHIAAAFGALGRSPYTIGPATDGGYWLIGARQGRLMAANVLDGVRWSSPNALSDTVMRLRGVTVLPCVLDDVDNGDSFRSLTLRQGSFPA